MALYVGDLSPEVTENDLFAAFNAVAAVTTIRVCRSAVTRESLGYAYVNFHTAADAEKAMTELNYTMIKGRPCRIAWSQRDPSTRRSNVGNLFVKNLGPEITTKELYETFRIFGNILSCKVAVDDHSVSKGYGFVHFETEDSAKKAIENVNGLEWAGRTVECKAYVAKPNRSGPEWNNLYIKNVPREWTDKALRDLFEPFGEIVSLMLATDATTGKSRGFGFVCYKSHTSASNATKELNGREVEGTPAPTPFKAKAAKAAGAGAGAGAGADAAADIADKTGEGATAPAADGPTKMKLYVGRALKKVERERQLREAREAARADRIKSWVNRNLWVCNLDESVDDEILQREFGKFGTIESAIVARDGAGRSRLFGYVLMSTAEEASKAIGGMNKKLVQGKPLSVRLWESKEQRDTRAAQRESRRAAASVGQVGTPGMGMMGGAGAPTAGAGMAGMMANPFAALAAMPLVAPLFQQLAVLQARVSTNTASPADIATMQQLQMQLSYLVVQAMLSVQQQQQHQAPPRVVPGVVGPGMARGGPTGGVPMRQAGYPTPAGPYAGVNPAAAAWMAQNPAVAMAFQSGFAGAAGMPGGMAGGMPGSPTGGRGAAPRRGAPAGPAGSPAGRAAPGPQRGAPATAATVAGMAPGATPGRTPSGAPTAAAVVARGIAPVAGAAPAGGAPAVPGAAAVAGGAVAPGGAATMAYRTAARNVDEPGAVPPPAGVAATATVPTPVAAAPPASFSTQLAAAPPAARKNMIGERLYQLIVEKEPTKAGKITGMLLEGMDEGELLHLLETPTELVARIGEALEVLRSAESEAQA